jgi:protein-S-isoprenylcysteine O-methyltransferase Ste14
MRNRKLGKFLFWIRSYLLFPLVLVLVVLAKPSLWRFFLGLGLMMGGKGIRIWAAGYIGGVLKTTSKNMQGSLVTAGPYAHLRNPLYVGNFILGAGACVMSGINWWIIFPIFFVLFIFQYWNIILFEEATLREKFGQKFEDYCSDVPRVIPKLKRFVRASAHNFGLRRALRYEKRSSLAMALLILLIGLRFLGWGRS